MAIGNLDIDRHKFEMQFFIAASPLHHGLTLYKREQTFGQCVLCMLWGPGETGALSILCAVPRDNGLNTRGLRSHNKRGNKAGTADNTDNS